MPYIVLLGWKTKMSKCFIYPYEEGKELKTILMSFELFLPYKELRFIFLFDFQLKNSRQA